MNRAAFGAIMLVSCKHPPNAVTVGAAISLKESMDDLAPTIERDRNVKVEWAFGASGDLASQMERGAPFDVLVAAGEQPRLSKIANEKCTLAWNTLVLVKRRGTTSVTWSALDRAAPSFRLAIGLVPQVPAGVYAEESLKRLGEWDAVAPKVVRGTNVRNVLDLVARGEADEGVVYATDAPIRKDVEVVEEVPPSAWPNVRYPVYVANAASATSTSVAEFLCQPTARKTLVAHGFLDHAR
jgi:molybdate transport system substrate-binding protein